MENSPEIESGVAQAVSAARRLPVQQRSRERVERMLSAATSLIAEEGSDAMRMGDVAERAGVSIGSLYQYFPDKAAIIRMLAERYNAEGRVCIEQALSRVDGMEGLASAFEGLVDTYYGLFLAEPVMRDIWCGTQADRGLRDIELADSRANGEILGSVLVRLRPEGDAEQIAVTAFLVMQLGEAAMRTAISVSRSEGDRIVATYKRMAIRELTAL